MTAEFGDEVSVHDAMDEVAALRAVEALNEEQESRLDDLEALEGALSGNGDPELFAEEGCLLVRETAWTAYVMSREEELGNVPKDLWKYIDWDLYAEDFAEDGWNRISWLGEVWYLSS